MHERQRAPVGLARLGGAAQPVQHLGAGRVQVAVVGERQLVDDGQAGGWSLGLGYGRGGWSEHILAGPPDVCATGIRAVADAGAELILLNPIVEDAHQLERLAAEVIPALS